MLARDRTFIGNEQPEEGTPNGWKSIELSSDGLRRAAFNGAAAEQENWEQLANYADKVCCRINPLLPIGHETTGPSGGATSIGPAGLPFRSLRALEAWTQVDPAAVDFRWPRRWRQWTQTEAGQSITCFAGHSKEAPRLSRRSSLAVAID